jgi:hypothetical protein
MKRGIITLVLIVLMCSLISAEMIFTQPINSVYNLGDNIQVPMTIKAVTDISGDLQMNLICNGTSINFYKNGIQLVAGEEKNIDSSLILIRNIIEESRGLCRIKAMLNGEYKLTEGFSISNLLLVDGRLEKSNFSAGEGILIKGKITKEEGKNSNGIISATIIGEENLTQEGTITDGDFSLNISLPKNFHAGIYSLEVKAYERSSDGTITNEGISSYGISVLQVPTNLELVFENKEIDPNTSLKIQAVLHDQTEDPISSEVLIIIKDYNEKILEQKTVKTDTFFEYPVKFDESPSEWTISATSNGLVSEDKIKIKEKESANIEIVDKKIIITNNGNVLYNKTLLIKIDDNPLKNLEVKLGIGKSKEYWINVPEGNHTVVIKEEGKDNEVTGIIEGKGNGQSGITGGVIGAGTTLGIVGWIVLILILIAGIFILSKKIYKKPSTQNKMFGLKNKFGKNKDFGQKKENFKKMTIGEGLTMTPRIGSRAELSLSIKGEKQEASMVCVKIRNLREIKSGKGSGAEAVKEIIDIADDNKAVAYENQDYVFLILAPLKTRTMKNEKLALDLAEKVELILANHNRKFHQKVDYGISISQGAIIAKAENSVFKFMTMGTFMTEAKKIASVSKEEILLSGKVNDALRLTLKTEKSVRDGTSVFSITKIKRENEEARQFINKFMERQKRG